MEHVLVPTFDSITQALKSMAGVYLRDLAPDSTLILQTLNHTYQVVVAPDRQTYVQGGPFFPELTAAHLDGAIIGSALRVGWVGVGLRLEIHAGGKRIVTSPIHAIYANRDRRPAERTDAALAPI